MSRSFTRAIPALAILILLGPALVAVAQEEQEETVPVPAPTHARGFQFLSLKPGPTARRKQAFTNGSYSCLRTASSRPGTAGRSAWIKRSSSAR